MAESSVWVWSHGDEPVSIMTGNESGTIDNPSGIAPTEFKVLILQDKVEEKTKGGIIIPDETHERDQYAAMTGVIIAASPLAFTYENWPDGARRPQVGDRVVFAKYAGAVCKGKDGVDYRLINDRDVGAILT